MPVKMVLQKGRVAVKVCTDEIPGAYRNIDEVMANQSDLARIVHTLKQVVCAKG